MARGIWIDVGDEPNVGKLQRIHCTTAYFAAMVRNPATGGYVRNSRITPRYLYGDDGHGGWKQAVGRVGVYYGASWIAGLTPTQLAERIDADLDAFGADAMQCAVDVNAEDHAFDLVTFMRAFRHLRPTREVRWIIEGMQGGRLTGAQLAIINHDVNLSVAAEAFFDAGGQSMLPIPPDRVRSNLIDFGVARARALVCYDAGRLEDSWDGLAFTQQRLP